MKQEAEKSVPHASGLQRQPGLTATGICAMLAALAYAILAWAMPSPRPAEKHAITAPPTDERCTLPEHPTFVVHST